MLGSADDIYPIIPLGEEVERGKISGAIGRLQVIPISKLFIDGTYQRAVSVGSVRNIKRICRSFDWAKFLPVIVTKAGTAFHIVDGQHRVTAAATLGIKEVPCYILSCSSAEAAAAFAAINGNVTPIRPIDLWFAELAAKQPDAVALQAVLDAAGVKVTRKKQGFAVGETQSINVLRRALDFYGPAILTTILQCIVETGDGNPGLIIGAVVNGIGRAIRTKPNPMPESVADRPTSAHEKIWLLTKSERYYFDAEAIAEQAVYPDGPNAPDKIKSPHGQGFTRRARKKQDAVGSRRYVGFNERWSNRSRDKNPEPRSPGSRPHSLHAFEQENHRICEKRNARNVWTISPAPFPEAHFATFPPELVERCLKAGCPKGGMVLDPFGGSGTTALVADGLDLDCTLIELSEAYVEIARKRLADMFRHVAIERVPA